MKNSKDNIRYQNEQVKKCKDCKMLFNNFCDFHKIKRFKNEHACVRFIKKEKIMKYPICIEEGNETEAFSVVFPDFPGCFSAGDDLDEALENAIEAAEMYIEDLGTRFEPLPPPTSIKVIGQSDEYKDCIVTEIDINVTYYLNNLPSKEK